MLIIYLEKIFPGKNFKKCIFRHCHKIEVFAELFSKSNPIEIIVLSTNTHKPYDTNMTLVERVALSRWAIQVHVLLI